MVIVEVVVGIVTGVIITHLCKWQPINNSGNSERYEELLRRRLSTDHLEAAERHEFEQMARTNWKFENSRLGDVQTATLLSCLERMIERELDESRENIAIFMDQLMQKLLTTIINTPTTYEGTEKE